MTMTKGAAQVTGEPAAAGRPPTLVGVHKPMSGAPAYSRYINRPWGRRIALQAYRFGLTPDQVTAISALFTLSGLLVLALVPSQVWTGLAVAALLATGYAVDSADGQLARMRGGGSPAGEWLDHIVDAFKGSAIHLLIAIHLYRFTDLPHAVLLIPLAFAVVDTVLFFGQLLTDFLRRLNPVGAPAKQTSTSAWRSLAALPSDFGLLCWLFVLLPWAGLFVAVYALLGLACALFLAASLVRWRRGFIAAAAQQARAAQHEGARA